MKTVSTALPPPTSNSHLMVPSAETCSLMTAGPRIGHAGQLVAQRLGQIAHLASKSAAPFWWIQRNSCVARKRFSPSCSQKAAKPVEVEVEQVDQHRRRRSARVDVHAGKKNATSTAAVSGASEPCTALASMLSAKVGADGALVGLLRVGGAHQVAVLGIAPSPSSAWIITGPEIMKSPGP
jgi:hypothetical protein